MTLTATRTGATAVFVVCLLAALAAVSMRVAHLRSTEIILDEFQHLHSAHLVSRGETPYVDFFEHHPPLFYYLATLLVPMQSPTFDTIIHARYLALAFHLLTILVTTLWIRTTIGRTESLVVATLLLGSFFLFAWGSFIYLDTFAAPFLVLTAWALARSERLSRTVAAGACFAVAVFLTQKAAVGGLAILTVLLGRALSSPHADRRFSGRGSRVAAFAAGGLAVTLLVAFLLGRAGVMGFVRDAIVLNLGWKARHFPTRELSLLASTEGVVAFMALVGLWAQLRRLVARRLTVTPADVPALFLFALCLGIFVLPVVWEEYFVMLVPFGVTVAGMTAVRWWREYLRHEGRLVDFSTPLARRRIAIFTLCGGLIAANILARYLVPREHFLPRGWFLLAASLCLTLVTLAFSARRQRRATEGPLWLAVVVAFALVQQAQAIGRHSNAAQAARVTYLLDNTTPADAILDGYAGLGVFRPHAYTYWFLHDEMRAMLTPEQKGPHVVQALESAKPPFVIVDRHIRALPEVVRTYIATHYQPTEFPDIVRRRPALARRDS